MPAPIVQSSSIFIEFWIHGLYTTLMLATLHTIVTSKIIPLRRKFWQTALVIVPYACSTIHMATDWLLAESAIDDNESSSALGVIFSLTRPPTWETGLSLTAFAANILLADFVFIWRCWTVWGRNWLVVLLPTLSSITGAVMGGITIADQIIAGREGQSLVAAMRTQQFVSFSTVFFALSITTSLMTTLLIAGRIISVQRASGNIADDGSKSLYNSTIEILVESAAIYSITLLAFIVVLTSHHTPTAQFYAQNFHAQIAGLAPLLIIYRIAARHARPDQDWEQSAPISLVRFNHSDATSTRILGTFDNDAIAFSSANQSNDGEFKLESGSAGRLSS